VTGVKGRSSAGSRAAWTPARDGGVSRVAAGVVGALVATAAVGGAAAQEPAGDVRLGITYQPGYVPGLVVTPVRSATGLDEVASIATGILRQDLDYSDRFDIISVPDSLPTDGRPNYGLWNELGAVWLVTADVSGSASAPILRVGLHDVVYGNLKNVQAFTLPGPDEPGFRMAVHRASDAVVSWATDGDAGIAATRIAFRRKDENGSSLWIVDSDGENARRIETGAYNVFSPAFSPDGTRLAYQVQDEDGAYAIVETNLVTGRRRTVSTTRDLIQTPTYSPNGSLAWAETATSRVQVMLEGRGAITNVRGDALNPTFSPDGEWFAYESDVTGEPQVYVQRVAGGSARRISIYTPNERTNAVAPDWSPKGDRIAYAAYNDGNFQIFTVNPDGTDRRMLTSRGESQVPSWAPDGRHVVFESRDSRGYALWIIDTVTGRSRTLTSGHMDMLPDWSPSLAAGARSP